MLTKTIDSIVSHVSQLKVKEREHFLRATLDPLSQILDGLVGLFTFGLFSTSFTMKSVSYITKKEIKKIILKNKGKKKKMDSIQKHKTTRAHLKPSDVVTAIERIKKRTTNKPYYEEKK